VLRLKVRVSQPGPHLLGGHTEGVLAWVASADRNRLKLAPLTPARSPRACIWSNGLQLTLPVFPGLLCTSTRGRGTSSACHTSSDYKTYHEGVITRGEGKIGPTM
jgi:hypothetical protein